jgi:hypothetical protein
MSLSTVPASPILDEDLGGGNDDDAHEKPSTSVPLLSIDDDEIEFIDYVDESQLEHVMKLVIQDLSEPYSSTLSLLSCGDAPSFARPCLSSKIANEWLVSGCFRLSSGCFAFLWLDGETMRVSLRGV